MSCACTKCDSCNDMGELMYCIECVTNYIQKFTNNFTEAEKDKIIEFLLKEVESEYAFEI